MNDFSINQTIAIQILRWTQIDEVTYRDTEGFFIFLTDFCNSISHALDLAMAEKISLMPLENGTWRASALLNSDAFSVDSNPSRAICLATLALHEIEV
jgi:hypothetical protein